MVGGKVKTSINSSLNSTAIPDRSPVAQLVAPWPEWSDADINAEKWETRAGPLSDKQKVSMSNFPDDGFESPLDRVCMPPSIPVHVWRRSSAVNPGYKVLPEDENALELDLVSCNEHILYSEIMRHLVTSIVNLHHLAAMKPFDDVEGDSYVPNGGGVWKPWHHVYSMCKAGKGSSHKPSTNKSGKYIVRLHFLGKWRRITVDDYLPFDEHGRILLPTTPANELWPILLAKAVFRVAALTWTPTSEVVEMNAISCFTGWFMLNIECKRVPAKDIWLVCQKALMNEAEDGARYTEEPKLTDAYQVGVSMGGGDRRDRKDTLTYAMCNALEESWGSVAVFAEMAAIDGLLEEEVAEIGPCVGHQVLFTEARVIRLGDDGGPLPLWKTFRWKNWALKTGIIQPEHLVNVKSLRVFAPLKRWVVPNAESLLILYNVMKALQLAEEAERAEQEKEFNRERGSKKKDRVKSDKSSEKKSGTTKASSKKSSTKKVEQKLLENSDPWINFNVYSSYVKSIQLFFRASSFKYRRSTSTVSCFLKGTEQQALPKKEKNEKKTPKGKSSEGSGPGKHPLEQRLISTCKYKQRRTPDCFYLMSDTTTSNKMFITISGVASNAITEQEAVLSQKSVVQGDRPPMSLIIMNITEQLKPSQAMCRSSITTVGTKSALIQFGEGVVGLRMWTNLPPHHFIQIVSQANFKIGSHEVCHEMLGEPSVSLVMYGGRIFEAFANLKKCVPGSPEHVQALAAYHSAYLPDSLVSNFSSTRSVVRFTASMRATCEQVCVGLLYDRLKNDFEQFYSALKELQELMLAPEYGVEYLQTLDSEMHEKICVRTEELARPPEEPEELLDAEDAVVEQTDNEKEDTQVQGIVKTGEKKHKEKSKPNPGKKSIDSGKIEQAKKSLKSDGPEAQKKTVDNLIPHILFDKKIASGITIMGKIVDVQPDWALFYPFRGDLKERIAYKDYVGTAPVSPVGDWFPILRIVLNMDHGRAAANLIHFSTSAALSFVHLIDNDTQKQFPISFQNTILSNMFVSNTLGYTYFAYGFCDNALIKEHSYKLHIVAPDDADLLHCCQGFDPKTETCNLAPPPPLKVQHVYGHYIPNRRNKVFQCILTVRRSQVLTVRVSTNNPKADILVKITHDLDENEQCELIYEKQFSGKTTLPSLYFSVDVCEGSEEQHPKVFLIEGRLATEKGWQLTETEQNLVVGIKERVQKDMLVFHKKESTLMAAPVPKRLSSDLLKTLPKSQEIIPESAYWCVQVVVDSDMEKTVKLELNRRKEQEIRKLKEDWEKAEPGRHIRAMRERQKVLEMRAEENRRTGTSFEKSKLYQSFQLKDTCICPEFHKEWKVVAEDYGNQQEKKRKQERQAFDEILNEAAAKRSVLCQELKETNGKVNRFLAEQNQASRALLDAGYRLRAAVVKATEIPGSKEKKENKKKNSGKPGKGPSKKRNML